MYSECECGADIFAYCGEAELAVSLVEHDIQVREQNQSARPARPERPERPARPENPRSERTVVQAERLADGLEQCGCLAFHINHIQQTHSVNEIQETSAVSYWSVHKTALERPRRSERPALAGRAQFRCESSQQRSRNESQQQKEVGRRTGVGHA